MRSLIVPGLGCALVLWAGVAFGQATPPASAKSDTWAPASASTVSYGSSAGLPRDQQKGSFRFKDDDKSYGPRISLKTHSPDNGRAKSNCESNPTASTCRSAQAPQPGL
jgi:hypothetical protein